MKNEFDRLSAVQPLIKSLYEASKETLGFNPDAKIVILTNEENSNNPLGKTAYYDPGSHKIGLYTQGRHVKDIMRSLSHELVHHSQNCRGDFNEGLATVEGYAQEDGHLREMEREAYETGNLIFRDWEDNYKRNDSTKLFTDTSIMGEKLMEDKETKLREVIRGLVKEMLVTVKEDDGDSSFFDPEMIDAASKQQQAADAGTAALAAAGQRSGVAADEEEREASSGDEDQNESFQTETEAHTPGGGDKADEREEHETEVDEDDKPVWSNDKPDFMKGFADVEESFFPTSRDIREKARHQTNEALMKRWGYTKKND